MGLTCFQQGGIDSIDGKGFLMSLEGVTVSFLKNKFEEMTSRRER
jgi:hypothetical protein